MTSQQHVYLAAHLGDAVLSCGGQMAWRVQCGETVQQFTVFAGEPDEEKISPFARMVMALGGHKPFAGRIEEEVSALRELKVPFRRGTYWRAMFRVRPNGEAAYPSQESLHGEIAREDLALINQIAAMLSCVLTPDESILYAPLAASNHIDHKIVRAAAEKLGSLGYSLYFYETFPYAEKDNALANVLHNLPHWRAQIIHLPPEAWKAQIAALAHYPSLIATLFGNEQTAIERLQHYKQHIGLPGHPAERIWQKRPAEAPVAESS